ncbi:AbrB/MazE/SpoVT family DNA-binding domain-containing protein [Streptomyces sp. H10-C2]|uniref:AbrB/MazE/SpoVT family DNA-binding domain-containing protein n=1 Tax=unclassified Streptomyces TaxID=2593676 RepID=UPI0024BABD88|nr:MULTISPECIES: AbrB/MazE/SpoVT family DNA-binding domain-containing protein [unclassified Streptomyces]MDJ0342584.1 AbrB/MazE/SpoVT family DNA-binding domain-containing protein [Streptomyces sp. PH10-H1]MDJ0370519.1 AbrB/MazE/SpoVT family DNA-binding domain-containing protein [Streptomyces sp. H10-C2]
MKLNAKGQVTIPAGLRAKYGLREGDEIDVVEDAGVLRIVRVATTETHGQRLARRMRGSATAKDVNGLTTDELMGLLRGE